MDDHHFAPTTDLDFVVNLNLRSPHTRDAVRAHAIFTRNETRGVAAVYVFDDLISDFLCANKMLQTNAEEYT